MTNPHIETLVNFLRDFADANADSFAPEQIDYLNQAAVAIKDLTERHAHMSNIALSSRAAVHQTRRDLDKANKERDSARWEVCELSGNGSIDSAMRVAEERGWNLTEEDSDAEESH
jgi:hypothetical protein